jgi:hypothetical protein
MAVAIAEGHHFVAFEVFVPIESEMIAAFLRYGRGAIARDDADVEIPFLVKLSSGTRENGIAAPMNFIASKGSIDAGGVNLRLPRLILCNG